MCCSAHDCVWLHPWNRNCVGNDPTPSPIGTACAAKALQGGNLRMKKHNRLTIQTNICELLHSNVVYSIE